MSSTLAQFQDAFIDALYARSSRSQAADALASQPAFSVYRNTMIKACIDALAANFPSVTVLAGAEWARAAFLAYARSTPPSCASLREYGHDFPQFLASYPGSDDVPYLADVARLDHCWNSAHAAADAAILQAADLARLAPEQLGALRLRPHPSATWAWFPDMPVYTIWNASRDLRAPPAEMKWQGEGALLVRRDHVVHWQPIDAGACAFLDACASGVTLEQACGHALLADPALDISGTLSVLINAAAFCGDQCGNRS
jgi:hypothetical protein